MIKIAVDSMGGDYAPEEIVKGAIMAAQNGDVEILLVGPIEVIDKELGKYNISRLPINSVKADGAIKEGESPAFAIRRNPNASIAVAMKLVKAGIADALVSAGSTGAVSVSAITTLGMLPGLKRPTVCVPLIGLAPNTVLVDGGANIDCKPHHMLSFATIGCVYAKKLLGIARPKVALLSIGTEAEKGTKLIRESYRLLKDSNLDFIGNIEGYDILGGQCNVIVCDGIVGNVLMKFYESMGRYFVGWLKAKLGNIPLGGSIKKLLDQMISFTVIAKNESDSGGLLWGVDGAVHLLHGNSKAHQVSKTIAKAKHAVEIGLIASLKTELSTFGSEFPPTR
ncbi:MAG: phosphate acyltransferase PlsX [Dehalococcoidia bacterium]|nr:phosphate acyltransferase PlsX [Dehalococcoidia bacterium]